jgi:hypothetical protein
MTLYQPKEMIPMIPRDAVGLTATSARLWFKGHAGENDLPTRNQQLEGNHAARLWFRSGKDML